MKLPEGMTTISGQVEQSRNDCPGLSSVCAKEERKMNADEKNKMIRANGFVMLLQFFLNPEFPESAFMFCNVNMVLALFTKI